MDETDKAHFALATNCHECGDRFGNFLVKVDGKEIVRNIGKNRHHDHLTGIERLC